MSYAFIKDSVGNYTLSNARKQRLKRSFTSEYNYRLRRNKMMKKDYAAPEMEMSKFSLAADILSESGGDTPIPGPEFYNAFGDGHSGFMW